ncbi:alpha/beta fold hydrolase [Oceanobacillus damuensis]|uniref:alpha/beta fold hydrolase n=1 Tax=Oceanobacillus damuensis TaxID=937928 RepID=UPI000832A8A2|nr:alpha/beta hydrolase [Oceanobacillus damuensis]
MPMLDMEDSSLYYSVKGSGTPILFIHPPVLTSANFHYQREELSRYFQVITFDIRGHGKSPHSSQTITYPLIARDMEKILDHLGIEKAFLCGYSTGGSIVLEFMQTFKERSLGGIVIGGMSETRHLLLKYLIRIGIVAANSGAVSLLAYLAALSNADSLKLFKMMVTESRKSSAENIEQYYRYILKYNCTDQLGSIDLPVLLVYGMNDKPFHSYAKLLEEKLPQQELVFIDQVMHQIPTKASPELNNLIKSFISNKRKSDKK